MQLAVQNRVLSDCVQPQVSDLGTTALVEQDVIMGSAQPFAELRAHKST